MTLLVFVTVTNDVNEEVAEVKLIDVQVTGEVAVKADVSLTTGLVKDRRITVKLGDATILVDTVFV